MNVLGAMSKLQQWALIPAEAAQTMQVIVALERESNAAAAAVVEEEDPEDNNSANRGPPAATATDNQGVTTTEALTRAFFFRGFAQFHLGTFITAEADFKKAMELSPGDTSFQDEWNQLQTAMQCEKRVKDLLNASRQQFQTGKYKVSIDCSLEALRECHVLQRDEYTGLIHGNLAAAYTKVNDDVRAIEHYKRALVFARKSPNQTAPQKERIYDLLSALAACYSRRNDFSSAHSVILDALKQFPDCPSRRDLESHLYLNAGRVCFTLGKFTDAEIYLIKSETAAMKQTNQTAIALNALLWLSKTCRQLGKDEQTVRVLDKALALVEKDGAVAHQDMLDQFLLAKLDLVDPVANPKFKLVKYESEASVWKALEHFEKKKNFVRGHLRAAEVLVYFLNEAPEKDDVTLNKLERVLFVVDRVNIGQLASKEDIATLMKLVLWKVDFLVLHKGKHAKAQNVLVTTLSNLPSKGKDAQTLRHRSAALKRLAEIFEESHEVDDEVQKYLDEALAFLRSDTKKNDPSSALVLSSLLSKFAQKAAKQGDVLKAQELLEESVALARQHCKMTSTSVTGDSETGGNGDNSEQLCGALIGLCVLQMKQRNMAKAQEIIEEIDGLPCAEMWKEMYVIKDQLRVARETEENEKLAVEERKRQAEAQQLRHHNSLAGWWERWWFAASVGLVGVALFVLQVMEQQQKLPQQQQDE